MGLLDRLKEKASQVLEKAKEYEVDINGTKVKFHAKPSEMVSDYEKDIASIGNDAEKLFTRAKQLDAEGNSDSFWYYSKGRELGHAGCMYEWARGLLPIGEYPLTEESKAECAIPIAALTRSAQLGNELAIQEMMARGLDNHH